MNITFCINTAKNERNHIELLFRSLYKNLSRRDYPIIVYVENDNQETTEWLISQKQHFPNLKIIKNPLPIPIGYARNINMMFEMAQTDVVSYLQSDMVICPLYDLEIAKYLTPDTIISATRIEPPLHPPSNEKITYDFGLDPLRFDLNRFSEFANVNKKDNVIDFWFAPFTLYKKNWIDIGGHDTLFRRSREDSDLLYRFSMKGLKMKQVWNAFVYHFTCISSRGLEWWTEKGKARTMLQQKADVYELARFSKKWGMFKHSTVFNPEIEYKYQISANFKNASDPRLVHAFSTFHKIYVDNSEVREKMRELYETWHTPANELLSISKEEWGIYKKYYRTMEFDDVFPKSPIKDDDIIFHFDLQRHSFAMNDYPIEHNKVVYQVIIRNDAQDAPPGDYELEVDGGVPVTINRVINRLEENLVVKNPPIDDITFPVL